MSGLLRKLYTTLLIITCCCFVTLGNAQSDAIIVGKIDSPVSRVVRFEYKRNHFSLEEGSFEATLDTNNVFSIRVKLNESRAIFCTYRENAIKLFIAPGDTLKMRFTNNKMLETISFDGTASYHNEYLVKSQKEFPDWLNENPLVKARIDKGSRDYLAYIDSIFLEKRSFFDRYPAASKANFTNDFLEFATNDINYWRAYELMLYVKTYGLNNTDPARMIDDSYFNFTLETDNIYYKALNNEYYLQYLELYLGYLSEKSGTGRKEPMEVVEERSRYIKTVKPKGRNLRVIEEPYLPRDVVSWLAPNEEAIYQNLLTGEKFKYVGEDSTYDDIFLKVKTSDGKTGWVPQSAIAVYEKTIIERTVHNRFCFQPEEPLCGFDKHLSGKVLYFTVAKDIMYSLVYDKIEVIDVRVKNFIDQNIDHKEYNNTVRTAYDMTIKDRAKGLNRLNIPQSCDIEEYWKDRIYYAKALRKLQKENNSGAFPEEVVIDYISNNYDSHVNEPKSPNTVQSNSLPQAQTVTKVEPSANDNNATKTTVTKVEPTANDNNVAKTTVTKVEPSANDNNATKTAVTKVETPANDNNATKTTVTKVETPANDNNDTKTTVTKVETPANDNNATKTTVTKVETPANDNNATKTTVTKVETPANDNNATKTEPIIQSKPKQEDQPVVKSESKTNYNVQPAVNFSVGDDKKKLEFNTPTGFIPLEEYDPTGKPLIFKGMVINEYITPFEFNDIANNPIRQQDFVGKVVVLNFWATWCGPCKPTIEYTQRLANKYSDKDVVFIYVSADSDLATWKEYLKEHPIKGIQGLDDNRLLRINLRVQGVPNYFIIDKTGRVAYNSIIQSKYTAEEMIDVLLKSP